MSQDSSAQEYLDRYGVTTYLKDVITLVLENRPDDPIDFIGNYFNNVVQGTSPMIRSYRYIKLTKRNRAAFFDNLVAAYNSLCQTVPPSSNTSGGSNPSAPKSFTPVPAKPVKAGVTGSELKKLIKMVCIDFPSDILRSILKVLNTDEKSIVSFNEFACAINTCLLYEDFLLDAEKLFHQLDKKGTGSVDALIILNELVQYTTQNSGNEVPTAEELQKCFKAIQYMTKENNNQIGLREFLLCLFQLTLASDIPALLVDPQVT